MSSTRNTPSWRSRHQIITHQDESRRSSWRTQNIIMSSANPSSRELSDHQVSNRALTQSSIQQGQLNKLKRKASDSEYNNSDLDLDLSLKITPKDISDEHDKCEKGLVGEEDKDDMTINGSLTLSLSPSIVKECGGHVVNNNNRRHGKMASTLDLTL